MSFELDQREFQAALRQYVLVCKRTLPEILNRKLLFIARAALKYTPRASRAMIEAGLNVTGYALRRTKKGRIRKGKHARGEALYGGLLIYKIINARLGNRGQKGLHGAAMKEAAQKLLMARIRAIGSLKAGWVHPIRILAARLKEWLALPEKTPRVRNRGTARPAVDGWNPVAELEYAVMAQGKIDPRVEAALARAFREETASMHEYIARKMQELTDPFNGAPSGRG